MMRSVYKCRSSFEDSRPQIDFPLPTNAANDWLLIGDVEQGIEEIDQWPKTIALAVNDERASDWDCFMVPGTRDLYSQRFVHAVGKSALKGFVLLPAQLNRVTYYFLRNCEVVDCFDRQKAVYETFPHDPSRIMRIRQFAFVDNPVPEDACFCIPETRALLLTGPVANRIRDAGLRGIHLQQIR
jgi:hypothetical protein